MNKRLTEGKDTSHWALCEVRQETFLGNSRLGQAEKMEKTPGRAQREHSEVWDIRQSITKHTHPVSMKTASWGAELAAGLQG